MHIHRRILMTVLTVMPLLLGCENFLLERPVIVQPQNPTPLEELAAREVRRYVYLLSGELLDIVTFIPEGRRQQKRIIIARKDRPVVQEIVEQVNLGTLIELIDPGHYLLRTVDFERSRVLLVTGGDDMATLYGAYRFCEQIGVRFFLDGDVIPDGQTDFEIPDIREDDRPAFAVRGILPFHGYPEGPDWWDANAYKAVIAQLPKLGLNFIGIHSAGPGTASPEPGVWTGLPDNVNDDGTVSTAYPAGWYSTLLARQGFEPGSTGAYPYGADRLFPENTHGSTVMAGDMPMPQDAEGAIEVFDRAGALLADAFSFAHQLGVQTCAGTDVPLMAPSGTAEQLAGEGIDPETFDARQLLYEGMFRRAAATYDLDYFWLWSPREWATAGNTADEVSRLTADLRAAMAAEESIQPPFTLAAAGWVLGPQSDRSLFDRVLPSDVPMGTLNRRSGMSTVDPAFAALGNRPRWAMPWIEDDDALTIPQLWAARMRADALDAYRYGCTGLIGIHWRTRSLEPTDRAFAQAAWRGNQRSFSDRAPVEGPIGGIPGSEFPGWPDTAGVPIAGTDIEPVYRTARVDCSGYDLPLPNGTYRVILRFCEPVHTRPGLRLFSLTIQDHTLMDSLDIAARAGIHRAVDVTASRVTVEEGWLRIGIEPVRDYPIISGITIESEEFIWNINCGGSAFAGFDADFAETQPRGPAVDDLYLDWAQSLFGETVGGTVARIMAAQDGCLPRPASWTDGPGGIEPDYHPWEDVAPAYGFVDSLAALRESVSGAGNIARYNIWLAGMTYLRETARFACLYGAFDTAMQQVRATSSPETRRSLAETEALPAYRDMTVALADVHRSLLASVSTTGDMGTVTNWEQHILRGHFAEKRAELADALGGMLPDDPEAGGYDGLPRLFVPTSRTLLGADEDLLVSAVVLDAIDPQSVTLHWHRLGGRGFDDIELTHIGRGMYDCRLPTGDAPGDVEYYLTAVTAGDVDLVWPATAPAVNATVIRLPEPPPAEMLP